MKGDTNKGGRDTRSFEKTNKGEFYIGLWKENCEFYVDFRKQTRTGFTLVLCCFICGGIKDRWVGDAIKINHCCTYCSILLCKLHSRPNAVCNKNQL